MKLNVQSITLLIFVVNTLFYGQVKSHNQINGGCQSHCYKDKLILNNSNSTKNKNIKLNKNKNSCVNRNLCRG